MKKWMLGLTAVVLTFGIGTAAFAHGNGDGDGTFNFGQMQKYMQQMHPDWSEQDFQEMYKDCHGTNGAAPSKFFQEMSPGQNMMN